MDMIQRIEGRWVRSTRNCCLLGLVIPKRIAEQVGDETRAITLEVNHIKGSIEWPVWFLDEKGCTSPIVP